MSIVGCHDKTGAVYPVGGTYKINCNLCTCEPTIDGYRFHCKDEVPCVIQEDLYEKVHRGRYSWQAQNYSQFWGLTLEDGIRYRLGTLLSDRTVKNMNELPIEMIPPLPERFDAREKWPGFIHPIRDQGDCGASWAFSTTSTAADRLAIQSNGKYHDVLSAQQLLSCDVDKQRGCNGGYLDRAWRYIRQHGVVSEECYPYVSGSTSQQESCKIPHDHKVYCVNDPSDNRVFKMTPAYRISSKVRQLRGLLKPKLSADLFKFQEEDIMTEIMVNGPVQATFLVHEDFFMYKEGVYQHEPIAAQKGSQYTRSGYHSVRILGWGIDHSTGRPIKYWVRCQNSLLNNFSS
ncbi:unnamed protein product [Soboliphyme baturini]|uniref:Peptidase C1A papain C-terminal domain-containing protein n=1 Tax=Soboliphyme baturini TaxID=241478 RepID=A0A3P8ANS9_9BILA|nr:unnamed protein product [Soboliphyme baturini]